MGITTTYECDRCGHRQPEGDQMWLVGVSIRHWDDQQSSPPKREQLWCRKCVVDRLGLLPDATAMPMGAPRPRDLETMLREIIREEIENPREE